VTSNQLELQKMEPLTPSLVTDSLATKYYNLATLIIVLYDHCLTFDTEVEKIWSQRWSLPKSLWFVVSRIFLILAYLRLP
jgi:Family of unknown function (DUF6533)